MKKNGFRLSGRQPDMNMTEGSILKNIIVFALPLLLGNLFQQLYNMVDTWVIGQTGQNGAYAAVGSVGPIINILIGAFSGFATGAGVVISQYFGARDEESVSKAVHTSVLLTLILCVVLTALGVGMTPTILRWMLESEGEESEVLPFAEEYLTIYFAGISGLLIYNMGSGILRAIGDSRRPFYFLLVAAVTNTLLDLLFVFVFKMGVAGVAYATVIAQIFSAICTVVVLLTTDSVVRVIPKRIRIDSAMLKKIVILGFPAAVQLALTAFSNVFVQGYIAGVNGDQTYALSGWTTYSKIDQFIFLPLQSLALATTTFVGQNYGIMNLKRAKNGTRVAYLCATIITATIILIVEIFAAPLARLFNSDPAVVENAVMLLHYITPFYLFCCVNQIFSSALRGVGNSTAPMIIMLTSFVGFRQVYLFFMSNYISNDLLPIGLSYPAGWAVCAVSTLAYYLIYKRKLEKNTRTHFRTTDKKASGRASG